MYWCLPAANIYDKQERVCSHRFTPTSRNELRKLTQLVPRLRELGISLVVCSDLDAQSGDALARRLNVPYEEWQSLRRLNAGKLHGTDADKFRKLFDSLTERDVPVRGGDSHASFEKRIRASKERLAKATQNILVVADAAVLERLTGARGAARYHIYEVSLEQPHTTAALPATA